MSNDLNNLDKILRDMSAYYKPELLLPKYKSQINVKNLERKKIEGYYNSLLDINYFYKKIIKYETYFRYFYPRSNKIEKSEALSCHIYLYMEILDILRNRLVAFLGMLKNDLKKISTNKEEVSHALKHLIDNVEKTFDNVKKHRHPHHHSGKRLINNNIIEIELLSTLLRDDTPFKGQLNVNEIEIRKKENFNKAKESYINLSRKNSKNMIKLINIVFEKTNYFIYTVLNIRPLMDDKS